MTIQVVGVEQTVQSITLVPYQTNQAGKDPFRLNFSCL